MKTRFLFVFAMLSACVDPISFHAPIPENLVVVEGTITDDPGPYQVRISKSIALDADSISSPVRHAIVILYDDEGHTEAFTEASPGKYVTGGLLQGKIGHGYHITIEMEDGSQLESEPEIINPVGEIQNIKYSYEHRIKKTLWGEVDADVFNIFVDADVGETSNPYARWRFTGTYRVDTHPELRQVITEGSTPWLDPLPCGGMEVEPNPIRLVKFAECTCCTCYIKQYEKIPQVSDGQYIISGQFRNVKVGEVPINSTTFTDKYMVNIEQMSLSKSSFQFFQFIRAQKVGATNLFQPPYGIITGNIKSLNAGVKVVGVFWATSVNSKIIFINQSDVPYLLPPPDLVTADCRTYFRNSSSQRPDAWQ